MLQTTIDLHDQSLKKLLSILSTKFPSWKIKDLGDKEISHFHVTSKDPSRKGVLEITFDKRQSKTVTLKIADNRKTNWSINALSELKREIIS